MKKIVLFFLSILCVCGTGVAQETAHMKFMGVPMDGTARGYVEKLNAKQVVTKKHEDGYYLMSGKFANYADSEIYVHYTPKTKKPFQTVVYLPAETTWYKIKAQYIAMKELLTKKYGIGRHYEFFSEPYYEGDGYETQAVKLEKVTYTSFFNVDGGTVMVAISPFMQLKITYEDNINQEIFSTERDEQALEDI